MIPFRTLCARIRTAIKAMSDDERAALGKLPGCIQGGASYSYRVDPDDFLNLCARVGIDPMTGGAYPKLPTLGRLCRQSIGAGCAIQRQIKNLTREEACDEIGIARATLWRMETGIPISIESILAVCEFIGVHPFGYMQSEKKRAA